MKTNFSRAAKVLFDPANLGLFLLSSLSLSAIGNAASDILKKYLGDSYTAYFEIFVGALLILILTVWLLARRLARLPDEPFTLKQRRPDSKRGLILMVSRIEVCRKAIIYHQKTLRRCWLICSTKTLGTAQELREEFKEIEMPEPIVVNNIHDPLEYKHVVDDIYAHLPAGWKEEDVIADYTGMTAHGSVGMALSCLSPKRLLQYTPARYDDDGRPIEPLNPIEITLESFSPKPMKPKR